MEKLLVKHKFKVITEKISSSLLFYPTRWCKKKFIFNFQPLSNHHSTQPELKVSKSIQAVMKGKQ